MKSYMKVDRAGCGLFLGCYKLHKWCKVFVSWKAEILTYRSVAYQRVRQKIRRLLRKRYWEILSRISFEI